MCKSALQHWACFIVTNCSLSPFHCKIFQGKTVKCLGEVAAGTATADDDCQGMLYPTRDVDKVTFDSCVGNTLQTKVVTFTADDGCTAPETCTQTITFDGTDAPEFDNCPESGVLPTQSKRCPGPSGHTFTPSSLTYGDDSDCNDLAYTPPSATLYCNEQTTGVHEGMLPSHD